MLWIPNDTPVNVTGTVAQKDNAQGCYAMESNIYFNTPFLSVPAFLFLPISLPHVDTNVEHAPHTKTYTQERLQLNSESSL